MNETLKFVQLIENHECLYNNTVKDYARKDITEKAWSAISREAQLSVTDCKEKWKNIRNGFVRSLKPTPSGSSSKSKKPYYLHDVMQFVLPYVKPVQHLQNTGNISLPDTEILTQPDENEFQSNEEENIFGKNTENTNNDLAAEPSQPIQETPSSVVPKKKKRFLPDKDDVDQAVLQYIKEKKSNKTADLPEDDKKMFLLSLLPDVKSLSEKNLRHFKIKTLTLLEQLLTQQEQPITDHHFHTNERSRINESPKHCLSASCCSSGFSVNTIGTPAPSPIDVVSTPISIQCSTSNDAYIITDLDYATASTSTARNAVNVRENESFFFNNK